MKKVIIIAAVLGAIALIAVGAIAYSFFRTPEAASGPIEAVPLPAAAAGDDPVEAPKVEVAVESPAEEENETRPQAEAKSEVEAESGEPAAVEEAAQAEPADLEEEQPSAAVEVPQAGPVLFEIVPDESQASFFIDEVLRGSPVTVAGITDQVAGQIAVSPDDLATAQVGVIQINARTITTDNDFRNRAIKNRILRTDSHEFVTFTPSEVVGLPEAGSVGETYTFQITGDLSVTDITKLITFEVTVTPVSDTRLEGTATTAFLYTDFDLFIPDSPSVDTVDDEVRLELNFVAEAT